MVHTMLLHTIAIIIRIVISFILGIYAYRYSFVYNLHMFQLNGYKNGEHISWIRKHIRRQWVLVAAVLIGAFTILIPRAVPDCICLLWMLLIVTVYQALGRMSVKKPLVYTSRVKRLVATVIVLDIIVILIAACIRSGIDGLFTAAGFGGEVFGWSAFLHLIYGGWGVLARTDGILLVLIGLKLISCVAANIVNTPIERGVNRHFINDAKRILREHPDMTIIGVTGSYGKTSVKYYLGELLGARFDVLITPESYNTPMGVVRTIREHMKPGNEIFVCEMGARHVGDIKELCDLVHPKHGIITSIGPQHLETFFSMENIVSTKFELADALPADGMLFLNGDNEYVLGNSGKYSNTVIYSTGRDASYVAGDITLTSQGTSFAVTAPDGTRESFGMSLIGAHNLTNVTGAIAVAHSMGIPLKELKIPVRRLRAVPHRLELIRRGDLNIIDDAYNSNPVGSAAALDTLAMFDGMKVIITPGMVELGDEEERFNYEFGRHAARVCDYILLVGRRRGEIIERGARDEISGVDQGDISCDRTEDPGENRVQSVGSHIMIFDRFEDAYTYASQIPCDGEKYILLENDLPDNY